MTTATQTKRNALAQAIRGAHVTSRSWSIESAYDYCERLARSHYENFPVGSVLVPRALRKHFYSIYAFARTADDFADEGYADGHGDEERFELLEEWRAMLAESDRGRASHPVFVALAETRSEFDLPITLFEDLLSAFTQDVRVRRYLSFDELLDYCRRSANPIGRLILLLFGHRDGQLHKWSDSICTGLQLANHWQDVGIDLAKDRIYIPAEDLARFSVSDEDLRQSRATEGFKRLMEYEVARARELFARGKPLCLAVGGRLGLELRVVWLGGARILDRIEANDYDIFARRPVITSADKLRILFGAAGKGSFRRHG
ncbi:MAG TPA: squalene synthase HpnC [Blastocatellia bacterium]|nr:squalene synthase HpnC [Blastocatellia bacterium]